MATVSGTDQRGWRQIFLTYGLGEDRTYSWEAAADQVNAMVELPGWTEALAPGFPDLDLGVRPVYLAQPDRRNTRAIYVRSRERDLRSGKGARMDVPIEVPREWGRIDKWRFQFKAVTAILDGLHHLGVAAGVGPPVLRDAPLRADEYIQMSDEQRAAADEWVVSTVDALPPGNALVAGLLPNRLEPFLDTVKAEPVESPIGPGTIHFWRVDLS
jgi:hypothetical protein